MRTFHAPAPCAQPTPINGAVTLSRPSRGLAERRAGHGALAPHRPDAQGQGLPPGRSQHVRRLHSPLCIPLPHLHLHPHTVHTPLHTALRTATASAGRARARPSACSLAARERTARLSSGARPSHLHFYTCLPHTFLKSPLCPPLHTCIHTLLRTRGLGPTPASTSHSPSNPGTRRRWLSARTGSWASSAR